MHISAVVAMSENRVIGKDNQLPWHLPADLQHFKKITMGKPIIMGRKTFESIGKPLPGRNNIIITRDKNFKAQSCIVVHSIEEAISSVKDNNEIFIIGGAELFKQTLPNIQRLYLTIIHHVFDGDTYFPEINSSEWREVEREFHAPDANNIYSYSFVTLETLGKVT